jgi:hypothetical protein
MTDANLGRQADGVNDSTTPVWYPYRGTRSIRSNLKNKIETCSVGERSKVTVSREEGNASVDTGLGDQGVAEPCLAAFCYCFGAQYQCFGNF